MPIYVYKGGATRIVKGITLRHKGQEIELKSLKGIVNANRLILKKEQPKIIKKIKKVIPEPILEKPVIEKIIVPIIEKPIIEKKIVPIIEKVVEKPIVPILMVPKVKGGNNWWLKYGMQEIQKLG